MMEIHSIRRDAAVARQEQRRGGAAPDRRAENLDPLINDLANASLEDVDLLIDEYRRVRDMLHSEGARLDRELARYASANRSLMETMKVIRERLAPVCGADLLCMARRSPPFEHI